MNPEISVKNDYNRKEKALAWSVHFFTASGLVAGFLAIIAITQQNWQLAMAWLFVTVFIDGVDGTLARKFRVQQVLPFFDGKTIDYVIDFFTYAIIPTFFLYQSGLLPDALNMPCAAAMLLVSAFYYGKKGMVSDDMHFIGFPVMWNYVIFYMFFVFSFNPWANAAMVIAFCILHFVPIKYLYPSRTAKHRLLTLSIVGLCFIVHTVILWIYPDKEWWLSMLAILVAAYFGFMGVYKTYFSKENEEIG